MEIEYKNIKVAKESWRAVKVFAASRNCTIRMFVEEAIQEKLQRESSKTVVALKEEGESTPKNNSGPGENEFKELFEEIRSMRHVLKQLSHCQALHACKLQAWRVCMFSSTPFPVLNLISEEILQGFG